MGVDTLCLTLSARTASEARRQMNELPAGIHGAEIRLDRFDPADVAAGAWRSLPQATRRPAVLTWRSPEEGGERPRPPGIWAQALASEYAWVDVEARALEAGDPEALDVPAERRWVSRHESERLRDPQDLDRRWGRLRRHAANLHKLVVPGDRFEVNAWTVDFVRDHRSAFPRFTLFATGWIGHPSRILGHLAGNAVTFVAPEEESAVAAGQPSLDRVLRVYQLTRVRRDAHVYGVLGCPARHSRSPDLQNAAFRDQEVAAVYLPLEVPEPEPVFAWLRAGRLHGVSVTSPFKPHAFAAVERRDEDALRTGAVNTIWRTDGGLAGTNTDVVAARTLAADLGLEPGDPVAVVGAGGAAASLLCAAMERGLRAAVFNRSEAGGRALAERFSAAWGGPVASLDPRAYRAVMNATPLGASAPFPDALRRRDWTSTAVVDLAYGRAPTAWEAIAREAGAPFRGGLHFLAVQGAEQFFRWTGIRLPAVRFHGFLGGAG